MQTVRMFHTVQALNMIRCGLQRLLSSGFQSMKQLRVLDVRGSALSVFAKGIFQGLDELDVVYADNYKLGCPGVVPDGFNAAHCHAPSDEISSCQALLRSSAYRGILAVFSTLSSVVNGATFLCRVVIQRTKSKQGFGMFVSHLCVADFLMGVYLALVGVADRMYQRTYLWNEATCRHSPMCKVAGLCSLLSSEVSAIVCLITLDRFLVLPVSLPERLGPPGLRFDVGGWFWPRFPCCPSRPIGTSTANRASASRCPSPGRRSPARLLLRRHDRLQLPPLPAHRRGAGLHLLVSQRRQDGGPRQQQALQGPDHRPPAHHRGRVGLPLLVPHRLTRHPGLHRYPGPWRGQRGHGHHRAARQLGADPLPLHPQHHPSSTPSTPSFLYTLNTILPLHPQHHPSSTPSTPSFLYTLNTILEKRRRLEERRLQKLLLGRLESGQDVGADDDVCGGNCMETAAWGQLVPWLDSGTHTPGQVGQLLSEVEKK